ncbi:MAG: hypothetical protein J6J44_14105 [Lachnospiraceae bacterium]|nr:hypothetical protein [Lachnospiraceae bacterium]
MGLVTCEKCKKIYDYDKYNGICPKCARYNRENSSAQEHQDYHNKYDGGYSHNEQDDHHSYHQRYDDNKNPHANLFEVQNTKSGKIDKKTKTIIGVVVAIIVLTTLLPFFSPFLFFVAIWALAVFLKGKKKK